MSVGLPSTARPMASALVVALALGIGITLALVRCVPHGWASAVPTATPTRLPPVQPAAAVVHRLPAHYQKLDPALRTLTAARGAAAAQAARGTLSASAPPAGRERMTRPNSDLLWVLVHGDATVAAALRQLGATVAARAGAGSPYVARIAASDLERLAARPGVSYVEASRPYRPVVDVSVPATGAVEAWKLSSPSSQPLTGHGVLIAVVDTGADWSHPDLRNADGTTRILHLLDQTCGVSGYEPCATTGTVSTAGREWTASDINGWLTAGQLPGEVVDTATGARLPDDTFPGAMCDVAAGCGHGTHVASVAAGTGYSHGTRTFRGVAPDADLLVVRSDLESASIMRAWSWIIEKAKALNKPVVIINAFGFDYGPHDGTASVEQELDRLSGPGVIFVVAAGNAGAARKHASGTVADGTPSKFAFRLAAEGTGEFSLWYASTDEWEFRLVQPGVAERGPRPARPNGHGIGSRRQCDHDDHTRCYRCTAPGPYDVESLVADRLPADWRAERCLDWRAASCEWQRHSSLGCLDDDRCDRVLSHRSGWHDGRKRCHADADRAGERRPRHYGGGLQHARDMALRPAAHTHTHPSGRHHAHSDQHSHPDRHGNTVVYEEYPKSCNTSANSWRCRALQFAGADARRPPKTRSHRARPADYCGTGTSGPDPRPGGTLRQYPSGDASRHESGRRPRGWRHCAPAASQSNNVTGRRGRAAPKYGAARRVHRRAHGYRDTVERTVGRRQATSPPRCPDGNRYHPHDYADTDDHSHTDQHSYPHSHSHGRCYRYRHEHPHSHCYHHHTDRYPPPSNRHAQACITAPAGPCAAISGYIAGYAGR